ncbi:oxidoreductase [Phialemonium atrogriseum]|uniref:Oxidoreductase n=1 Tax=Phialemonium atrogriseum TaxID=1093897 RepID=A0AAJ0BX27_9PEZI|nr:oxidoreductase [Phialemonium atrogriseum]KAK1765003.1 oxidoreductase [Phialemonium atrogriseum]
MAPLNILIVGCSIAGPTLATFLLLSPSPASAKPRITILERSSALRTQGQNVDIRGVGVTIIRKLGLETAIRASTTGEEGVQWVTKENRVWSSFRASGDERMHSPTSDIEIMRGRLADICWKRSKAVSNEVEREGGQGIEYVFGDHLDELDQDGMKVHVRFAESGERRTFDLVVGADGLQSQTRKMVWGAEGEEERVHRLDVYGAFFSIPQGETDTMWRRCFHTEGRRVIMVRPSEESGRTTVFLHVANEKDKRFPEVATSGHDSVEAQKALIKEYFQDAGWESERIIREMMATKDFYYEIVAQVKMDRWSKGRVVLLGDAAYCASPMSGMGTTLAMYGAYNLAGALSCYPDDPTLAFAEYEEKMRPSVDRAQKLMPGMFRIMNPETAWGVWIVDTIISLLVWSRLVKLLLMFKKPERSTVPVEEYGLGELPEWRE